MDIKELSDIQSESGVIGTLIYHPEYIAHTDYLKPNHFFGVENGCIFWVIQELFENGISNIDAFNISNKIQSNTAVKNTIEKFNLPNVQEFVELYKETARHSIEEYKMLADNIVSMAFKRELIKVSHQIESNCYQKSIDLDTLSLLTYKSLDGLTESFMTRGNIQTFGSRIDDIWDEIQQEGKYGLESKFTSFNTYWKYQRKELYIIEAYKKNGKSMFLMNEAINMIKNGVPTLVYDSEMGDALYLKRLLSHLSGVSFKKISELTYSNEEYQRVMKWKEWLKNQPFEHIYDPGMSMKKLFSVCRSMQNSMNLSFVIYDYLKSNEKSTGDNYNKLGEMTDYLKNEIAGRLNLPVLAACQLNRNGEVGDSKKIEDYCSVAIKWGKKTQEMIAKDGIECGNAYAKVGVNRLGESMVEDDNEDYLDFIFDGAKCTIEEAQQHKRDNSF